MAGFKPTSNTALCDPLHVRLNRVLQSAAAGSVWCMLWDALIELLHATVVVQVMALLAYLYEFKQNYGPHLIIVPNAVIVNWKAELQTWLPDFRCVYYTGSKEERVVKFQNVRAC
jgi:SWI/SNF-related matrix-associated actin-dependent regulator of chromatin subfamily A protein 2/4